MMAKGTERQTVFVDCDERKVDEGEDCEDGQELEGVSVHVQVVHPDENEESLRAKVADDAHAHRVVGKAERCDVATEVEGQV